MSRWMSTLCPWLLLVLAMTLLRIASGVEEICSSNTFRATCQPGEVIIMDLAEYGRMEVHSECGVTSELGHVGCRNDFLPLLDERCSGRRECMFVVGDSEFFDANTQCVKELRAYLRVSYSCVKVEYLDRSHCLVPKKLPLFPQEGFIASHVTDETGCGTVNNPWTIDAMPGQTIELQLYDFGALSRDRSSQYVRCQDKYGFIIERSVAANESICGSRERVQDLYSSASHSMEIQLVPRNRRRDENLFLIRYRVDGCSDLTPPANSYYERDGNEAVIGCDGTDISWPLRCNGNTWDGQVGNCTAKIAVVAAQTTDVPMKPLLIVAAIIGATVVIAVLIIVSGVVYIKRYRHAESVKTSTMQWTLHYQSKPGMPPTQPPKGGTYRPMTCTHAHPMMGSLMPPQQQQQQQQQAAGATGTSRPPTMTTAAKPKRPPPSTGTGRPLQHIWEMPLPDPHATKKEGATRSPSPPLPPPPPPQESLYMNPTECTCANPNNGGAQKPPDGATLPPPPPPSDGDDVSSFYDPAMGHKYYVLERQDHNIALQNLAAAAAALEQQ